MSSIIKKALLLTPLLIISNTCLGAQIECIELVNNSNIQIELNSANLDNCFIIKGAQKNSPINFISDSPNEVSHKIILANVKNSSQQYISEYNSGTAYGQAFSINSTDREISFSVRPTSKTTTNKGLSISSIPIYGQSNIIINLHDIPSKKLPFKPIIIRDVGDCRLENGSEVCTDVQ